MGEVKKWWIGGTPIPHISLPLKRDDPAATEILAFNRPLFTSKFYQFRQHLRARRPRRAADRAAVVRSASSGDPGRHPGEEWDVDHHGATAGQ